jgi:AhpD family alkylhydroperoxidase
MSARFDVGSVAPGGMKAMMGLHAYVQDCDLDHALLELVKIRASQINGCAFCIAMHIPLARKLGVSEERMHLLAAWREAPVYSLRERAALGWAEALTRLTDGDIADSVYQEVRQHFSDKEIADLALAVVEITGWNRLMIGSRTPPQVEAIS